MVCSICGRVSGSGGDHLDCVEKRRVELEDEKRKKDLPEKISTADAELGVEIRALLDHMSREKDRS